jgi:hypothetical protein
MKNLLLPVALFGAFAASANALNIVWVSDQFVRTGSADTSDNNATPNGVFGNTGTAVGPYADEGFLTLLTGAGHTVTRYNPPDNTVVPAGDVTTLNTYDLVILGRSLGSGHFDSAGEVAVWNEQVLKPMMITNTYLSRSNRLGLFSTTGAPVQPDQVLNPLTFTNTGDAAQAYLLGSAALVPSTSTTADSITQAITFPNDSVVDIRGISNLTGSTINAGGTVIATSLVGSATSPFIATWPAGITLATTGTGAVASGDILGGFRMQFLAGNRESATAPNTGVRNAGYENFTAEGEAMFLRAVALAGNNGIVPPIPEPSVSLLAGLFAALGLIRRRR